MKRTVLLVAVISLASVTHAAVWHVAPSGDDTNDGSAATPFKTIGRAAEAVGDWDEIHVSGGLYEENVTIDAAVNGGATNVTLKGGYDAADWTHKPADQKTVVRAADATKDVIGIFNCYSTRVDSVALTGGKRGVNCEAVAMTFERLAVTNNTNDGIYVKNIGKSGRTEGYSYILSSLFAQNGSRGYGHAGAGVYGTTFSQCSFASNVVYAVQLGTTYGTFTFNNCLFDGNGKASGCHVFVGYGSTSVAFNNCCFGLNASGKAYLDSYGIVKEAVNCLFEDAKIGADFRLTAASKCNKKGKDLRAGNPAVVGDLEGEAFGETYDIGCYVSPYPFPQIGPFDDVYVSENGSDDSEAGNTPATALKTFAVAMQRIRKNGTLHVGAGTFSECPCVVNVDGVKLLGAGIGKTFLAGGNAAAALALQAANLVISNLTVTGGNPGIDIGAAPLVTNVLVACCDVSSNRGDGIVRGSGNGDAFGSRFTHLTLTNNAMNGFATSQDPNRILMDNVLAARNGLAGLKIGGAAFYVVNCTLADNGTVGFDYGTEWGNTAPNALINCIVSGNPVGFKHHDRISMRYGSVYNCLFADNGRDFDLTLHALANSNNVSFAESAGFVGKGEFPYRLAAMTPARGIGTNLTAFVGCPISVTDDLDGVSRNPRRWDDGCYVAPAFGLQVIVR